MWVTQWLECVRPVPTWQGSTEAPSASSPACLSAAWMPMPGRRWRWPTRPGVHIGSPLRGQRQSCLQSPPPGKHIKSSLKLCNSHNSHKNTWHNYDLLGCPADFEWRVKRGACVTLHKNICLFSHDSGLSASWWRLARAKQKFTINQELSYVFNFQNHKAWLTKEE